MTTLLKFRKLHPTASVPKTWSESAAALDLHAHLISETGRPINLILPPRMTRMVPTGIEIEVPPKHFGAVCSRSGLAGRSIWVANAPGVIDPDYRGEIKVLLHNGGIETQYIKHDDRIAQLLLIPYAVATVLETSKLSETARGASGFGSTGGFDGRKT